MLKCNAGYAYTMKTLRGCALLFNGSVYFHGTPVPFGSRVLRTLRV